MTQLSPSVTAQLRIVSLAIYVYRSFPVCVNVIVYPLAARRRGFTQVAGAWEGWPTTLDVAQLESTGGDRSRREFVLKIHSRCDLACDYCYMYTMADQSWRGRPIVMSVATIEAAAARIAEHAAAHELPSGKVSLHGGEPLLAGAEFITTAVTALRRAIEPGTQVDINIQTNGVRLDEGFLHLFKGAAGARRRER